MVYKGTATSKYGCSSEIEKPVHVLLHRPGRETQLAVKFPEFWGYDPVLEELKPRPEEWLEKAQKEHDSMSSLLKEQGTEVLYLTNLLDKKPKECGSYIESKFKEIEGKVGNFDKKVGYAILDAHDDMLASPTSSILLGLEAGKKFQGLPDEKKVEVYKNLGTLMPQTSIYFMQDPVISSPKGLIKARMAMKVRRQEPDIAETALGKENYIYRMKNRTEGGDVTMCSYAAGGDVYYIDDGIMLFGISALSGKNILSESQKIAELSRARKIVLMYMPDYFDKSKGYATDNVMHSDTILMPLNLHTLLGNKAMLEKTVISEANGPLINAYEWTKKRFGRIAEVPDEELLKWGVNVLVLGDNRILSSTGTRRTNKNLRDAGFEVIALPSDNLEKGYGKWHCMTAHI